MTPMEELAAQENAAAKKNWDSARSKIPGEVREIFRLPEEVRRQRMAEIIRAVADECNLSVRDILGRSRRHEYLRPRQYAMWKCREQGYSYSAIGRAMGRDHTTIMHGCEVIAGLMRAARRSGA